MNPLLKSLIVFLYPARCRSCGQKLDPSERYICKECWTNVKVIEKPYCEICGHPWDKELSVPETLSSCSFCPRVRHFRKVRSFLYFHTAVGQAIKLLKYEGKTILVRKLSELTYQGIVSTLDARDYDIIVPVPIHKKKKRKRGFNQMELIGYFVSQKLGIPMETEVLIKERDTPAQAQIQYFEERARNVKDSFSVKHPKKVEGKRILLIDDVMTTGATVFECSKTLQEGSPQYVDVFTLTRNVPIDWSS